MGPLEGIRIVEMGGIGPGPMAAMLLSDLGADVVRVERPGGDELGLKVPARHNLLLRGRDRIALDLKRAEEREVLIGLISAADALIEGFRPGAMERLGLGPDVCQAMNPRLVYGRMTGWGQTGPLAHAPGHDINYIALTGALDAIGRAGQAPAPPLNLVGDFGGGALYLALGIVAALLEARQSGQGQVVDAAMTEGAASLMTMFFGLARMGEMNGGRGGNALDSGSPVYDVYACADGQYLAVGALEPKFRAALFDKLGLSAADARAVDDRTQWPRLKALVAQRIATRTRAEWCCEMEGSDACTSPVLSLAEAPAHPHAMARGSFIEIDGVVQPAPAPRFSRTTLERPDGPRAEVSDPAEILARWRSR